MGPSLLYACPSHLYGGGGPHDYTVISWDWGYFSILISHLHPHFHPNHIRSIPVTWYKYKPWKKHTVHIIPNNNHTKINTQWNNFCQAFASTIYSKCKGEVDSCLPHYHRMKRIRNMRIRIQYKMITQILFCLGLSLTLWRSHECLQKYLYQNLSTKVTLVKSNETVFPTIVICPKFDSAYNLR